MFGMFSFLQHKKAAQKVRDLHGMAIRYVMTTTMWWGGAARCLSETTNCSSFHPATSSSARLLQR